MKKQATYDDLPGKLSCCHDYEDGKRREGFRRSESDDTEEGSEAEDGTEGYGEDEDAMDCEEEEGEEEAERVVLNHNQTLGRFTGTDRHSTTSVIKKGYASPSDTSEEEEDVHMSKKTFLKDRGLDVNGKSVLTLPLKRSLKYPFLCADVSPQLREKRGQAWRAYREDSATPPPVNTDDGATEQSNVTSRDERSGSGIVSRWTNPPCKYSRGVVKRQSPDFNCYFYQTFQVTGIIMPFLWPGM